MEMFLGALSQRTGSADAGGGRKTRPRIDGTNGGGGQGGGQAVGDPEPLC